MSVIHPNVVITPKGMDADSPARGEFLQNVLNMSGAWHVRSGFGQVVQFDTGLAYGPGTGSSSAELGPTPTLRAHLGSRGILTTFGHEQIVSLFSADVFTGSVDGTGGAFLPSVGRFARVVLVSIYDLTTRELWEEVLHPTTTESGLPVERRHGVRETSLSDSFDTLTAATDSPAWFTVDGDALFFGSEEIGVYAYIPASFRGRRSPQLHGETWKNAHFRGESESCLIRAFPPANGTYSAAYAYLNSATFPRPTACCLLNRRWVYTSGRTIWFSDIGAPASVMASNFVQLWGAEDITAIAPLGDSLMVWTAHTTWFYQPPATGALVSGGALDIASDSVGCHGPNSWVATPGGLVWVDEQGVWKSAPSGPDIKDITPGVLAFWRGDGIANPMTGYWHAAGRAFIGNEQPPVRWAWDGQDLRVNLAYEPNEGLVIATFPTQRISLVWDGEAWVLWNYESAASPQYSILATQYVRNPWAVAVGAGLYLVTEPETNMVLDWTRNAGEGAIVGRDVNVSSWCLLEYGRGGGVERTIEHRSEDQRVVQARYYDLSASLGAPPAAGRRLGFYIDPWVPVPTGYTFPNGYVAPANTYLWPISFVVDSTAGASPDVLNTHFRFDNRNWRPVCIGATANIDYLLPSERLGGVAGFGSIRVVDGAGVDDPTGNEIRIFWDVPVGHGFTAMNAPVEQRSPLMYIPVVQDGGLNSTTAGIVPVTANIRPVLGALQQGGFVAWQQEHFHQRYYGGTNERTQSVDWVIKAPQRQAPQPALGEVKSCGLALRVKSRGRGASQIDLTSFYGLLNAACGSDIKDWTSQLVDYAPTYSPAALSLATDVGTLRTRFRDSSATPTMRERRFNNFALWGDSAVANTGNYLVDVEPMETVQISLRCQGELLNWMIHGHVCNRAEALAIVDMLADIVVIGGVKRRGR